MLILIILVIFFFYAIRNVNRDVNRETFYSNNLTKSNKFGNKIVNNNNINSYINTINTPIINKNILEPKWVMPYNLNYLNNLDKYNILNNFGIKNNKKRQEYINKINNNETVPFNSIKLLKNYDGNLNNIFTTISNNSFIQKVVNTSPKDLPEIYLVSKDNKIRWSYNTKELDNDINFYIYFDFVNKCDDTINFNQFSSLKISNNFRSIYFNLTINNTNNNNTIYKLEYTNTNKFVRIFVVLKRNNIVIKKSNNITTN